ncbi:MAG: RluA family pseudouridine synthase [Bacteroidetes bacterium]|nr:RluA family pseudouridine synthase [Bacteroidota bacterium]MCY4225852.1 RluA family pseudouridine synthase [Bacteroidota bacterium]
MMWLYEDNHLLTLNKPSGLLSQADSTGHPDVITLAKNYIKNKYNKPGNAYIGLVHRLDRPSSGTMVLARTSKAARRLSKAFRERCVQKKYIAVVEGMLSGGGIMEDYLTKEADRAYVTHRSSSGKYASLKWEAVKCSGQFTLISIELITGRAHQIRCQFSHRGYPVVGDRRYGAHHRLDRHDCIALHCKSLCFEHPVKKERMEIKAPRPDYWKRLEI